MTERADIQATQWELAKVFAELSRLRDELVVERTRLSKARRQVESALRYLENGDDDIAIRPLRRALGILTLDVRPSNQPDPSTKPNHCGHPSCPHDYCCLTEDHS